MTMKTILSDILDGCQHHSYFSIVKKKEKEKKYLKLRSVFP